MVNNMDEFNLCPAKFETLIFYILMSDDLTDGAEPGGGLLVKPLKSVPYITDTLLKYFEGLELSPDEGSQLRAIISARFYLYED